jgi:hypothetical protein
VTEHPREVSPLSRRGDVVRGRTHPLCRVRRCCCQHPLPSELHGRHFDACSSSIRQRFLPERGCPIGLGVNLSVTATGPATELTSVAQAAPAEVIATSPTVLLCLLRRLTDGLRPLTPEGSRPAFAWSDVAIGSTPVRPVTGRPSLPPSSFTRRPVGSPYGGPTLAGGRRAYHVASQESSWVRPRLDAGGTSSAPDEFAASGPGHLPFWSKPVSTFGLSLFTTLAAVHLGWPYHAPLVPDRRGAGSHDLRSRRGRHPDG